MNQMDIEHVSDEQRLDAERRSRIDEFVASLPKRELPPPRFTLEHFAALAKVFDED